MLKSEFVRQKLKNMITWVETHLSMKTGIDIDAMSDVALGIVMSKICENRMAIKFRDWTTLMSKIGSLPENFVNVVQSIHREESMHDKFWRYLDLFLEVFSNEDVK